MVPVIYLFEHGHIDLEWIKRAGVYSDYIKGIINNVITTLRSDDDRRYILGQPLVVADALNSPEFTGDRFSYSRNLSELLTDAFINYDKSVKPGNSLLESLKDLVLDDRVILTGGMRVQPDLNMPCGESLVRQVLIGKKRIRKVFGKDVKVGWNIDSFGHSNNLPQILKKAGFNAYVAWRGIPEYYKSGSEVKSTPTEFYWKGLNGDEILTSFLASGYSIGRIPFPERLPDDYLSGHPGILKILNKCLKFFKFIPGILEKLNLKKTLKHFKHISLNDYLFIPLGSDFTEPHPRLKMILDFFKRKDYAVRHGDLNGYFKEVSDSDLPVLSGDFNPVFEGVYSCRSDFKIMNNEVEGKYRLAEILESMASSIGKEYDSDSLDSSLDLILLNHSHDTICGCCIDSVYLDAMNRFEKAESILDSLINHSSTFISDNVECNGNALILFNQLSWPRRGVVRTRVNSNGFFNLLDSNGMAVPYDFVNDDFIEFTSPTVPALGYHVIRIIPSSTPNPAASTSRTNFIQDELFSVGISDNGTLILNKGLRSYLSINDLVRSGGYSYEKSGASINGLSSVEFNVLHGNSFDKLLVRGFLGRDEVVQEVSLHGLPWIDFKTWIKHDGSISKVNAVFNGFKNSHFHRQIPYGELRTSGERAFPALNYVRLDDYSILNKGVVEHVLRDGCLELGLLRGSRVVSESLFFQGPSIPTPLALMRGLQSFDYAFCTGDAYRCGEEFNNPLFAVNINGSNGSLPKSYSFLDFNPGRLAVTAVKKAEVDDSLIYRLFNPTNHPESIQVNDYLLTDLLEENGESINELCVESFGIYTLKKLL